MGVKGLWKILQPACFPIAFADLHHMRVGVDLNLWLHEIIKGLTDESGQPIPGAHFIGVLNRLSVLIYHNIIPVLVLDGPTPLGKRSTVHARALQRKKALNSTHNIAMQMVRQQLKHLGLRSLLKNNVINDFHENTNLLKQSLQSPNINPIRNLQPTHNYVPPKLPRNTRRSSRKLATIGSFDKVLKINTTGVSENLQPTMIDDSMSKTTDCNDSEELYHHKDKSDESEGLFDNNLMSSDIDIEETVATTVKKKSAKSKKRSKIANLRKQPQDGDIDPSTGLPTKVPVPRLTKMQQIDAKLQKNHRMTVLKGYIRSHHPLHASSIHTFQPKLSAREQRQQNRIDRFDVSIGPAVSLQSNQQNRTNNDQNSQNDGDMELLNELIEENEIFQGTTVTNNSTNTIKPNPNKRQRLNDSPFPHNFDHRLGMVDNEVNRQASHLLQPLLSLIDPQPSAKVNEIDDSSTQNVYQSPKGDHHMGLFQQDDVIITRDQQDDWDDLCNRVGYDIGVVKQRPAHYHPLNRIVSHTITEKSKNLTKFDPFLDDGYDFDGDGNATLSKIDNPLNKFYEPSLDEDTCNTETTTTTSSKFVKNGQHSTKNQSNVSEDYDDVLFTEHDYNIHHIAHKAQTELLTAEEIALLPLTTQYEVFELQRDIIKKQVHRQVFDEFMANASANPGDFSVNRFHNFLSNAKLRQQVDVIRKENAEKEQMQIQKRIANGEAIDEHGNLLSEREKDTLDNQPRSHTDNTKKNINHTLGVSGLSLPLIGASLTQKNNWLLQQEQRRCVHDRNTKVKNQQSVVEKNLQQNLQHSQHQFDQKKKSSKYSLRDRIDLIYGSSDDDKTIGITSEFVDKRAPLPFDVKDHSMEHHHFQQIKKIEKSTFDETSRLDRYLEEQDQYRQELLGKLDKNEISKCDLLKNAEVDEKCIKTHIYGDYEEKFQLLQAQRGIDSSAVPSLVIPEHHIEPIPLPTAISSSLMPSNYFNSDSYNQFDNILKDDAFSENFENQHDTMTMSPDEPKPATHLSSYLVGLGELDLTPFGIGGDADHDENEIDLDKFDYHEDVLTGEGYYVPIPGNNCTDIVLDGNLDQHDINLDNNEDENVAYVNFSQNHSQHINSLYKTPTKSPSVLGTHAPRSQSKPTTGSGQKHRLSNTNKSTPPAANPLGEDLADHLQPATHPAPASRQFRHSNNSQQSPLVKTDNDEQTAVKADHCDENHSNSHFPYNSPSLLHSDHHIKTHPDDQSDAKRMFMTRANQNSGISDHEWLQPTFEDSRDVLQQTNHASGRTNSSPIDPHNIYGIVDVASYVQKQIKTGLYRTQHVHTLNDDDLAHQSIITTADGATGTRKSYGVSLDSQADDMKKVSYNDKKHTDPDYASQIHDNDQHTQNNQSDDQEDLLTTLPDDIKQGYVHNAPSIKLCYPKPQTSDEHQTSGASLSQLDEGDGSQQRQTDTYYPPVQYNDQFQTVIPDAFGTHNYEVEMSYLKENQTEMAKLQTLLSSANTQSLALSNEVVGGVILLAKLLGVEVLMGEGEADTTLELLYKSKYITGVITNDNDLVVRQCNVIRHAFKKDKPMTFCRASQVESALGLGREQLLSLSLILGSDYAPGLHNVGPVQALEVTSLHPTLATMVKYIEGIRCAPPRNWVIPDNFPSQHAIQAYIIPQDKLLYTHPAKSSIDVVPLCDLMYREAGWEYSQTRNILQNFAHNMDSVPKEQKCYFQQQLTLVPALETMYHSTRMRRAVARLTGRLPPVEKKNGKKNHCIEVSDSYDDEDDDGIGNTEENNDESSESDIDVVKTAKENNNSKSGTKTRNKPTTMKKMSKSSKSKTPRAPYDQQKPKTKRKKYAKTNAISFGHDDISSNVQIKTGGKNLQLSPKPKSIPQSLEKQSEIEKSTLYNQAVKRKFIVVSDTDDDSK